MTDYKQLKADILKCEELFKKEVQLYNKEKVDTTRKFITLEQNELELLIYVVGVLPPLWYDAVVVKIEKGDFESQIKKQIDQYSVKNKCKKI